jgi:quercetin dioxygenase-like cupin family protein
VDPRPVATSVRELEKGDIMTKQKLALVLTLAGLTAIAQRGYATTGSGVTPSYKVVSSNANVDAQTMADKLLLLTFGSDRNPINILNVHQIFAPGGYSGWHTHSGPGIVIVEQGTITIEETEGCFVDYPQGSVLFEGGPGHIHNASNRTGTPVILDAYFFLLLLTLQVAIRG